MLKTINMDWVITKNLKHPKESLTFICDSLHIPKGTSIYLQAEPRAIINYNNYLMNNWSKYKYILTFDDTLLQLPNAKKYIQGITWINAEDADSICIEHKKFQISSLTGAKNSAMGHNFRHAILQRATEFNIPSTFYRSNFLPMSWNRPDNIHLFREFQFSLVIENSRQNNYFTEKLCDCLYTKTIPIYYGAPNIIDYFDTSGWIIIESESVDELLAKISILDNTWYQRHIHSVLKNYETVLQWLVFETNINHVLDTLEY
jgi:hypothetical protein